MLSETDSLFGVFPDNKFPNRATFVAIKERHCCSAEIPQLAPAVLKFESTSSLA